MTALDHRHTFLVVKVTQDKFSSHFKAFNKFVFLFITLENQLGTSPQNLA